MDIIVGQQYINKYTDDLYVVVKVSESVDYRMVGPYVLIYTATKEVFLNNFEVVE